MRDYNAMRGPRPTRKWGMLELRDCQVITNILDNFEPWENPWWKGA